MQLFVLVKKSISRNWEILGKPKEIIVADKSKHQIWFNLRDTSTEIEGYKFFIPTIYFHDSELDLIIANNFLKLYESFTQRRDTISLYWKDLGNPKNSKIVTTKIVTRNEILNLIKGNLKELRIMSEERNFHISIEERLDEVCSDNPLDSLKNTNHELIVIKIKNSEDEINVPNRIPYSIRDVEEFQQEYKDLLHKDLIRP